MGKRKNDEVRLYLTQCDCGYPVNRMRLRRLARRVKDIQKALVEGKISIDTLTWHLDRIEKEFMDC